MKIIVIGANGTIGRAVAGVLGEKGHEVVPVGTLRGEIRVDIGSMDSVREMYEKAWPFDGLICVAGSAYAGPLDTMGPAEFYKGIHSKLMGQVNLVTLGTGFIRPNGFFTLTSGNLAEEPKPHSAGLGLVNGALNGFVLNAALDLREGVRLNVVSPSVVAESAHKYGPLTGREPITVNEVAAAYLTTVESSFTGQIIRAYGQPVR
jgi:NAD(P)-dependent dehydrogenase (short-subunit alcohol dehydrogenase family)